MDQILVDVELGAFKTKQLYYTNYTRDVPPVASSTVFCTRPDVDFLSCNDRRFTNKELIQRTNQTMICDNAPGPLCNAECFPGCIPSMLERSEVEVERCIKGNIQVTHRRDL